MGWMLVSGPKSLTGTAHSDHSTLAEGTLADLSDGGTVPWAPARRTRLAHGSTPLAPQFGSLKTFDARHVAFFALWDKQPFSPETCFVCCTTGY